MKWAIGALAVLVVAVCAGGVYYALKPGLFAAHHATGYTMRGTMTAPHCNYGGGLRGAEVVVKDASNRVIGTALASRQSALAGSCQVYFTVHVPKAPFYQFTVNGIPSVTYSFNELVRRGWQAAIAWG